MKSFCLKFNRRFVPILFLLAALVPLHAAESYLAEGKPDAIALLAPPPLPESPEQSYDLAEVRAVFQSAPSNDVAAALIENKGVSLTYFMPALGNAFQPDKMPKTEAFLHEVLKEAAHVVDATKDHWKRPRPYMVDPGLASGKLQKSFSYPSGHSTESMTVALVLADLFPGKQNAIIAEARTIGWHRVEIARHYPTDIFAGRVLAQAIVREMKGNPDFQKDFAEAKAEIAAAQKQIVNKLSIPRHAIVTRPPFV